MFQDHVILCNDHITCRILDLILFTILLTGCDHDHNYNTILSEKVRVINVNMLQSYRQNMKVVVNCIENDGSHLNNTNVNFTSHDSVCI